MQWTVKDAAQFLKVSEDTIHEWIEQRGLPATLFDDRYHFNRVKLVDWAIENRVPIFSRDGRRYPSLQKVVHQGGIHRNLPGGEPGPVLREVVKKLPLPEGTDRDWVWQMLMAREQEGATALGHGIAVPHARHPIILGVGQALVGLCLLDTPLEIPTPDGEPVTILLVLVTPNIQTHLYYLGRMGHVLANPAVRAALQGRANDETILEALLEAEDAIQPGTP
jgi:PTS system nitrogen regulatory IIA component